jgi:hypothetical protein
MVSYASTNALSMLGGDDYTTLQEEIDDISGNSGATFVHKVGNLTESIDGAKTFTSDFVLNVPTSVTANVGGYSKLIIQPAQTNIMNDYIYQDASALNEVYVASVLKSSIDGTTTTITNNNINTNGILNQIGSSTFFGDIIANADNITFNEQSTALPRYEQPVGSTKITAPGTGSGGGSITLEVTDPYAVGPGNIVHLGNSLFYGDFGSLGDNTQFTTSAAVTKYRQFPTTTEIMNDTITNVATTAFKVQGVSGTDIITTAANSTLTLNPTTTYIQKVNGTDKVNATTTLTTNTNPTITNVATTAFKVQGSAGTDIITTAANTTLTLNPTTTYTQKVNSTTKINATTTTLALTSPATTIAGLTTTIDATGSVSQPGFINLTATDPGFIGGLSGKININAQTFLNLQAGANDYIRVAPVQILNYVNGATKIDIQSTQTTNTNATINNVASTAFKVQNTLGTDKLNIAPTLTTNTNDTINNVAATAFKVQNTLGVDKLNIAPTLTKNTNATITEVATTAFQVQNVDGTNRLIISPTSYSLNSAPTCAIFINAGTFLNVLSGTTMAWSVGDSMDISVGSTFVQTSNTSSEYKVNLIQKLMMTTTLTTMTNPTITNVATTAFKVQNAAGVDKLNIAPTLTTITNTNVDVVAPLHATSYFVGTTASGMPLLSHQILGMKLLANQGIGTFTYLMNFANNSTTLFPTVIAQPGIRIIPKQCCLYYDTGVFTGGGVSTIQILVLNNGGATCYQSSVTSLASGTLSSGSLAMTEVLPLVSSAPYKIQMTIVSTVAITSSTKNVYAMMYSQQA